MATDDLINTSIDEYLISLANSINHAQRYINQLRGAARDGQPAITYQLPQVDFELKLLFQVSRRPPASGGSQRDIAKAERGAYLAAQPVTLGAGDAVSSGAAVSTIKGSFIAVPVHGGTPPPVITISWKQAPGRYTIYVTVRSSIGEALPGREVHFNLDKDLAKRLNPLWIREQDQSRILPNTTLQFGVQLTDAQGQATNELSIGDLGVQVPVVIDVLGTTKTTVFSISAIGGGGA